MFHRNTRIVGLSATLPNYVDVAKFLHVNPEKGLFFFDSRFRPVPLAQRFLPVFFIFCKFVIYSNIFLNLKHKTLN
jgi:replicative superfamily II helicase